MTRSIYIASLEGHSGKSLVALGLVHALVRQVGTIGIFRPVIKSRTEEDHVVKLLLAHDGIDMTYEECIGVTYDEVHSEPEAALATIVDRYRVIEQSCDAVVIIGSDYTDLASPTELTFNGRVAANLGAPVLLVISGFERTASEIGQITNIATVEIAQSHASAIGVLVNRCNPGQISAVRAWLDQLDIPGWALPETPLLSAPVVADLMGVLEGELLLGDESMLSREAENTLVCGMNGEHVLERLSDGQLCIVAGDRPEVLIMIAAAHASDGFPSLAGVALNGGYQPSELIIDLVKGLGHSLPIFLTPYDSYDTARIVASTRGVLGRGTQRKAETALRVFEQNIDAESLLQVLDVPRSEVVTPLMFEAELLERARADRKCIVLAEGDDDRILRASSTLLSRGAVDLILLGVEADLRARAAELGLDLSGVRFVDPTTSPLLESFATEYARLREHRGISVDRAREIVCDVSYFATLMVHLGHADGMVSGAAHTTAHTITPAFEIIKTMPGTSVVSSVFFMCLEDRVLVYGDCAVIPDPTAEQLADIATSSAATAAMFGIDPRIAMLSYATGASGTGVDVDKVRTATALVEERMPTLSVDGPIQYDAAVDAAVAKAKMPGSDLAGRATVFIFPDLNTGNNTYKAVQRSAGAVAVGPILQGLNKPVNDLSRGATVRDIVNTVAITAIQAQATASTTGATADPGDEPSPS